MMFAKLMYSPCATASSSVMRIVCCCGCCWSMAGLLRAPAERSDQRRHKIAKARQHEAGRDAPGDRNHDSRPAAQNTRDAVDGQRGGRALPAIRESQPRRKEHAQEQADDGGATAGP